MTNQEYLNTILGKFGVSTAEISVIMLENDIAPDGTVSDTKSLKVAVYNQLPLMIAGMQDVSEGGYSIKWNLEGLKLWYSALAKELGLPDPFKLKPTAKGVSPW